MSSYNKLTDNELIILLKEDEIEVFFEIYNRYWKKLYGFAYRRLKDQSSVEKLLQDFFIKIWIKRQTINIKPTLALFLFASVRNGIIDFYRDESTRPAHVPSYKDSVEDVDRATENYLNVNDLENLITYQIQKMPPTCRDVCRLSHEQNKSNKEIAVFKIPKKLLKTKLQRH